MASLKTTREALFIGHASGFITDAEFLLLHQENSSDNLDFPYDNYPRFSLQDQSEADCKAKFRLETHLYGPVGELLLCLSDRSSLLFLYLPYKNKHAFKKKVYLYLTNVVCQ